MASRGQDPFPSRGGAHTNVTMPGSSPTLLDMVRATVTRKDPKQYLFFNQDEAGKRASQEFIDRLKQRTQDRDTSVTTRAFITQLKAIRRWGRSQPADLGKITQQTLITNGDHDRMVPSNLSN